jgi:hypothetical protein
MKIIRKIVRWKLVVPGTVLSVSIVVSAFGQSNPNPSNSMSAASDPMKQAGSDTGGATKHAHAGGATVLRDRTSTAQAKTMLHEESATEHSQTYVHITAGVFGMPLEVFDNE